MQKISDQKKAAWLLAGFISIPALLGSVLTSPYLRPEVVLSGLSGEEPGFSRRIRTGGARGVPSDTGFVFGDPQKMECVIWDGIAGDNADQLAQTLKSVLVPGVTVEVLCDAGVFPWQYAGVHTLHVNGDLMFSHLDYLAIEQQSDVQIQQAIIAAWVMVLLLILFGERIFFRIMK